MESNPDVEVVKSPMSLMQKPGLIVIGLPGSSKTTWVENEISRIHELGTTPLVRTDLEGGRGSVWENEDLSIWEAQEPSSCYSYYQRFSARCQCQGIVAIIDARRLQKIPTDGDKWYEHLVRYVSDWLNLIPKDLSVIFFLSHVDALPGAEEMDDERRVELSKLLSKDVDVFLEEGDFTEALQSKLHASRQTMLAGMEDVSVEELGRPRFRELVMLDTVGKVHEQVQRFIRILQQRADLGSKVFLGRKVQFKWSEVIMQNSSQLAPQLTQLTAWVNVKAPSSEIKQAEVVDAEVPEASESVEQKPRSSWKRIFGLAALFVVIASLGTIPAALEQKEWSETDSVHLSVMEEVASSEVAFSVGDSFASPDQFCRWYLEKGRASFPKNHGPIIAKWFAKSFVSPLLDATLEKLQGSSVQGWDVNDQRSWSALVTLASPSLKSRDSRAAEIDRSLEQVLTYLAKTELYTDGIRELVLKELGSGDELNAVLSKYQRPAFFLLSQNLQERVDERLKSPEVDESVQQIVEIASLYNELSGGREDEIIKAILGEEGEEGIDVSSLIDVFYHDVDRLAGLIREMEKGTRISRGKSLYDLLQTRAFGKIEETFDNEVSFILGGNTEILQEYHRVADIEKILAAARSELLSRQGFKESQKVLRSISLSQLSRFIRKVNEEDSFLSLAGTFVKTDNLVDPLYIKAWSDLQKNLKKPASTQSEMERRVYEEWEAVVLEYLSAQLRVDVYDRLAFPIIYDDQKIMSAEELLNVSRLSDVSQILVESYAEKAISERSLHLLSRHNDVLGKVEGVAKTLITEGGQMAGVDIVLAPYESTLGKISENFGLNTAEAVKKSAAKKYGSVGFNTEKPVRLGQKVHQKLVSVPWSVSECSFRLGSGVAKTASRKIARFRGDWALCRLVADKLQQGAFQVIQENGLSILLDDTYGDHCVEVQLYSVSNLEGLKKWPSRFELNDVMFIANGLRSGQQPGLELPGFDQPENLLLPSKK